MTDIHALIREFLQQQTIIPLSPSGGGDGYTKAGVVPFVREAEGLLYYMMKPRGRIQNRGEAPFQICKGTRQYQVPGVGWHDMRGGQGERGKKEALIETALREGIEELGLKLENIARLFELGEFGFSSVTTGKPKEMWLFAAEMKEAEDFLPERDVALATAARAWLSAADFMVDGRDDHRPVLAEIERRLAGVNPASAPLPPA